MNKFHPHLVYRANIGNFILIPIRILSYLSALWFSNLYVALFYIGRVIKHVVLVSSETQQRKTDVMLTCFFHPKSNNRKPTSGQDVFFIWNLTSENRPWANLFFSSEIWCQANLFYSSGIRHQKIDVWPLCFFHLKSDVWANLFFSLQSYIGKATSGKRVFFHRESNFWPTYLFHWTYNIWKLASSQRIFCIRNLKSKNWCLLMCFFHWKSGVGKLSLAQRVIFIGK